MCSIQGHAIATSRSYDNYQKIILIYTAITTKLFLPVSSNESHKQNLSHYRECKSLWVTYVTSEFRSISFGTKYMCRIINSLCASKQSQLADIYRSRDDYVQPFFTLK